MDNAVKLVESLVRAGWSVQIIHQTDTRDNPFITVEAAKGSDRIRAAWHTRFSPGTYRLISCLVNNSDTTLRKAHHHIANNGNDT